MSEQQQGPGWWQASDGRWYPPETAPGATPVPPIPPPPSADPSIGAGGWTSPEAPSAPPGGPPAWGVPPPPPVPPAPKRSTGKVVGFVVLGIVAVLVALGAIGATVGGDDDGATSSAVRPATPDDYDTFVDAENGVSMDLAPGWVGVALDSDVTNAGAEASPDDPAIASAIDNAIGGLPRQAVFFAINGDDVPSLFVANVNILSIPVEAGTTLEAAEAEAEPGLKSFGATDISTERMTGAMGEGVRVSYSYAEGVLSGVDGRQYYFLDGETGWILTFVSQDIEEDEASFDAMAASFRG